MAGIVETLSRMTRLNTLEEVWRVHTSAMKHYGFDRLLYALTVTHRGEATQSLSDVVVLSSHDKEYTDRFIQGGMHREAPMLKWALNNVGACSWSWLAGRQSKGDLSAPEKRVLAVNLKYHVVAGYTISFPSGVDRRRSAIALTAEAGMSQEQVDEIWSEHGEAIDVLNQVMNLCALTLPAEKMLHRLTNRQREVLELVADGMSMAEIAERLGLSAATVEKHMRLARMALDCDTTAQAVTKAIMQQQLYVSTVSQKEQRAQGNTGAL